MKRAIAFAKLEYSPVLLADGNQLKDDTGTPIYGKRSSVQDGNSGWTLLQEFYQNPVLAKSAWAQSDLRYEVLTTRSGEIITDANNEPIYVL
jgi:hypothetical protein